MITECYTKFKKFSTIRKIIFLGICLQLLIFTSYEIFIHSTLLEGIGTVILCYVMGISMPYYNYTIFNQNTFYFKQEDIA